MTAPPQRPPTATRHIPATSTSPGLVLPAVPPFYSNGFEVRANDYDLTIKFQQRNPYLEQGSQDQSAEAAERAKAIESQLPAALVAMSKDAARALIEQLQAALQ